MDDIKMTIESGIRPLDLFYFAVIGTEFQTPISYRSQLRVNSTTLGTLLPRQYLPVALRNNQCVDLSLWSINEVCLDIAKMIEKEISFLWLSVYMPIKLLKRKDLKTKIKKILDSSNLTDTSKLCIELPSEVLFEEREPIVEALNTLRSLGITIMIEGFGNEFCPTLRLSGLPVDYVFLDEYISEKINNDELSVADSVISFAIEQGCKVILDGVNDNEMLTSAYQYNCIGGSGKCSGRYKKIKSILR